MTNEQTTIQELQAEVKALRAELTSEKALGAHADKREKLFFNTSEGVGFYFQERAAGDEHRTADEEVINMQEAAVIGQLRALGLNDIVKDVDALTGLCTTHAYEESTRGYKRGFSDALSLFEWLKEKDFRAH